MSAGRTIDFSFDVSQARIIGKKCLDAYAATLEGDAADKDKTDAASDKASQITTTTTSSGQSSNGDVIVSGWRKPQLSQVPSCKGAGLVWFVEVLRPDNICGYIRIGANL